MSSWAAAIRAGGTIALSWGRWGGVYLHRHRLCLGWAALTFVPVEIDDLMRAWANGSQASHNEPESLGHRDGGALVERLYGHGSIGALEELEEAWSNVG